MTVYVVTKEGVYRHEILGIYSDKETAVARAKKCCGEENDDYHNFEVGSCELNEAIKDVECIEEVSK